MALKGKPKADKKSTTKNIKALVLAFLKRERFFFDPAEYNDFILNNKMYSFKYISERTCTEKFIREKICIGADGKSRLGKSSLNTAINGLVDNGEIISFRFRKSDNKFFQDLPLKENPINDDDYDNPAKYLKLLAIPKKIDAHKGADIMASIGGQIVAPSKLLRHFDVTFEKPNLDDGKMRFHFSWGIKLFHVLIKDSIWEELEGRPISVFLSNSFEPESKTIKEKILNVEIKELSFFDNIVIIFRLPLPGILPPMKMHKTTIQKDSKPPLLGTIAFTFYPGSKDVMLTRFVACPLAVNGVKEDEVDLDRSELEELLSIDKWVMSGARWPDPLDPSISTFKVPVLGRLDREKTDSVNRYLSPKTMPSLLDCIKWLNLHKSVNGSSKEAVFYAPKCNEEEKFCDQMKENSWVLPANVLIGIKQTYFAISN